MIVFNMMEMERDEQIAEIKGVMMCHNKIVDFLRSTPEYDNYQNEEQYDVHLNIDMAIYRQNLSTCMLLCQLWEHQMAHYIRESIFIQLPRLMDKKIEINYNNSVKIFEELLGFKFNEKDYGRKLSELRHLVNYIKHAEGDSAQKFRKKREDMIIDSDEYRALSSFSSPLIIKMIKIDDFEIEKYQSAILDFWCDFSKNVDVTVPPSKLDEDEYIKIR
ncbi:hypothetical protein PT249_05030 [Erysipelothrix rhusiopathiae]|nr:hypothetical protein [Erysipelothrix rhusiopathiae]